MLWVCRRRGLRADAGFVYSYLASTSGSSTKTNTKGKRELKRLACSINYDAKGGHSHRDKGKVKGIRLINEA